MRGTHRRWRCPQLVRSQTRTEEQHLYAVCPCRPNSDDTQAWKLSRPPEFRFGDQPHFFAPKRGTVVQSLNSHLQRTTADCRQSRVYKRQPSTIAAIRHQDFTAYVLVGGPMGDIQCLARSLKRIVPKTVDVQNSLNFRAVLSRQVLSVPSVVSAHSSPAPYYTV